MQKFIQNQNIYHVLPSKYSLEFTKTSYMKRIAPILISKNSYVYKKYIFRRKRGIRDEKFRAPLNNVEKPEITLSEQYLGSFLFQQ